MLVLRLTPPDDELSFWSLHVQSSRLLPWNGLELGASKEDASVQLTSSHTTGLLLSRSQGPNVDAVDRCSERQLAKLSKPISGKRVTSFLRRGPSTRTYVHRLVFSCLSHDSICYFYAFRDFSDFSASFSLCLSEFRDAG